MAVAGILLCMPTGSVAVGDPVDLATTLLTAAGSDCVLSLMLLLCGMVLMLPIHLFFALPVKQRPALMYTEANRSSQHTTIDGQAAVVSATGFNHSQAHSVRFNTMPPELLEASSFKRLLLAHFEQVTNEPHRAELVRLRKAEHAQRVQTKAADKAEETKRLMEAKRERRAAAALAKKAKVDTTAPTCRVVFQMPCVMSCCIA